MRAVPSTWPSTKWPSRRSPTRSARSRCTSSPLLRSPRFVLSSVSLIASKPNSPPVEISATVKHTPLIAMLSPFFTSSQGMARLMRRNFGPCTTPTTCTVRSTIPVNMRLSIGAEARANKAHRVAAPLAGRVAPPDHPRDMPARELRDMVVVITGASAGIGRELAVQLHDRGARLALAARRLDRLNELNTSLGGQHLVVSCDVSKQEDCERLVAQTQDRFGRIDTLICNAGYGIARSVAQTSAVEMLDLFRTNVFGTTDCIRAAVP